MVQAKLSSGAVNFRRYEFPAFRRNFPLLPCSLLPRFLPLLFSSALPFLLFPRCIFFYHELNLWERIERKWADSFVISLNYDSCRVDEISMEKLWCRVGERNGVGWKCVKGRSSLMQNEEWKMKSEKEEWSVKSQEWRSFQYEEWRFVLIDYFPNFVMKVLWSWLQIQLKYPCQLKIQIWLGLN